jgi:hypothetical protein
MSHDQTKTASFIVGHPAGWARTDLPGDRPAHRTLDELLGELRLAPLPAPGGDALDDDDIVGLTWMWVGAVRGGAVVVTDPNGHEAELAIADLRVLEAIRSAPTLVGDATRRSGVADAPVRLRRLRDLAIVRTGLDRSALPDRSETEIQTEAQTEPRPEVDADLGQSPAVMRRWRGFGRRRATVEPVRTRTGDDRIPVYAPWHPSVGPALSLGMLTAAARAEPDLDERYEIRRPERADEVLADLRARRGPAILLLSDYVWSVDANLDLARQATALNPEVLAVHGGPSCPAYPDDAETFLRRHGPAAAVLCRGEGEVLVVDLLRALTRRVPELDPDLLNGVDGLTFLDPATGGAVRTPDRERIADLDQLPSPYTTGEFDDTEPDAWRYAMTVETNRGCPYGCTFCDWGSSTLSRIRKFSLDRLTAEVEWAASRGVHAITFADANFGIMSRDVEAAQRVADIKARTGAPAWVSFTPAKNTTKHLLKIMDVFRAADIVPSMSISLQSIDPGILEAVARSNISTDHYLALAADHRRHGHPLQSDVLLGVPEQTYDTYRRDLQFNLDHEILARTWPVQLLPNAPMNAPEYRARHRIRSDEHGIVLATATFSDADRDRMYRLRRADVTFEVFGLLRHVLRWVQWDHGIEATTVMDRLLDVVEATPLRFPHLTWVLSYFDLFPTAPGGWPAFYAEVRELLVDDLAIPEDSGLDTVIRLNEFLMPFRGRAFPATIDLGHDYAAYYQGAARSLYETGHAGTPAAPLTSFAPASLTVWGDPMGLCDEGPRLAGDSRDSVLQGDFYMAATSAYELHSPLTRLLPHVARFLSVDQVHALIAATVGPEPLDPIAPRGPDRTRTGAASTPADVRIAASR